MLKKIFDKNVSAASGELQDIVPNIAGLVADWLSYKIKITFSTSAGSGTTAILAPWKRAALFDFWYRDQYSDQAQQGTRNESFESMAQRAALYLDGSLTTSDQQFPDSITVVSGGSNQTAEFYLRVPFAPHWMDDQDDFAPNLQDLGLAKFVFPSISPTITGAGGTFTITAIEVLGYAYCRAKRNRSIVARRLFSRQPSQLPILADSFDISNPYGGGAARLVAAHINTSDTTGTNAITYNLQPTVQVDGTTIVDGTRFPNVAYISAITGDVAYPNSSSASANQRTYPTNATQFAFLVPPCSSSKASELAMGQRLGLTVLGSSVTAGTQYVNTDILLPLSDSAAANAVGVPRGAVNVERANSSHKEPTSRSEPFIPALVVPADARRS